MERNVQTHKSHNISRMLHKLSITWINGRMESKKHTFPDTHAQITHNMSHVLFYICENACTQSAIQQFKGQAHEMAADRFTDTVQSAVFVWESVSV